MKYEAGKIAGLALALGALASCGESTAGGQQLGGGPAPVGDAQEQEIARLNDDFNSQLKSEPGIHELPWVDVVEMPLEFASQLIIMDNPDVARRAKAPWQVTATGSAAQYLRSSEVYIGDAIFGETCQTCENGTPFSLTVVDVKDVDNILTFEVKPFRIQHAIYGEWAQQVSVDPAATQTMESEGLQTRQQRMSQEKSLESLSLSGNVRLGGDAGISFDPTANFSGDFYAQAGPIKVGDSDAKNCEEHQIGHKQDIGKSFLGTAATVWICVREFELSLTTNAFFRANASVDVQLEYGAEKEIDLFPEIKLGSIPLGASPLAINATLNGTAFFKASTTGKVEVSAQMSADVSVPVGIRLRNGSLSPFAEVTKSANVDGSALAEASMSAEAGVKVELGASIGLPSLSAVKFGQVALGSEFKAETSYTADTMTGAEGCLSASAVYGPYASAALNASISVAKYSASFSLWEGRFDLFQVTLFDWELADSCKSELDVYVDDLNEEYDIDYDQVCDGKGDPRAEGRVDISQYLDQPCAAMEELEVSRAPCDADEPTEECMGTLRQFFFPFTKRDDRGMCTGSVASVGTFTMEWDGENGGRIEETKIPGSLMSTIVSRSDINVYDSMDEQVSRGSSVLYTPNNGCLKEIFYTLTQMDAQPEDYFEEDEERGIFTNGYKLGDRITACVKSDGAITVTCPLRTITIPGSGGNAAPLTACLYGSSCSFSKE